MHYALLPGPAEACTRSWKVIVLMAIPASAGMILEDVEDEARSQYDSPWLHSKRATYVL